MRRTNVCLWAVLLGLAVCPAARSESAAELLEKGIYTEETVGDLDKAIQIYGQILAADQAQQPVVAQAQFRLAMCYQRKGDDAKSATAFARVLSDTGSTQAMLVKARSALAKLNARLDGPPIVLATNPPTLATDVPPDLDAITVTFDRPMTDKSWSWTGGGDTFPKIPRGKRPTYDKTRMTCTLPVRLEPGKVYWVGINSPSHRNFRGHNGVPAKRYAILFATKGKDGKPTPLPEDRLARAKQINGEAAAEPAARQVRSEPRDAGPVVVKTVPEPLDNAVSPDLKAITVEFDREMMDRSWSWTGGGDTYPKVTGKIHYDNAREVCTLPVQLQPGKVYWVGVNSPSHRNFKTPERVPVKWYIIAFATKGADGKPTPIPEDMAQRVKQINDAAKRAWGAAKTGSEKTSDP